MKILATASAMALVAALTLSAAPSRADGFSFSFNTGDVAFAYTDGYWDHAHVWHTWADPREAEEFRVRYAERYHHWHHMRDRDGGWHEEHHEHWHHDE